MQSEPTCDAMALEDRADKVWELGCSVEKLFISAADLSFELRRSDPDSVDEHSQDFASSAKERVNKIHSVLTSIREQESLFRYFACAYKNRLGGCYVWQDEYGKSNYGRRVGDDRPCECQPLPYEYQCYVDFALEMIEQLVSAIGDEEKVGSMAAAVPFLLNMTHDRQITKEFIAELRHEITIAVERASIKSHETAVEQRRELGSASAETIPIADEDTPALDRNEIFVLTLLGDRSPELLTIEDVAGNDLSRHTVTTVIKQLIDAGLAYRPKGERKGATLTPDGRKIMDRHRSGANPGYSGIESS